VHYFTGAVIYLHILCSENAEQLLFSGIVSRKINLYVPGGSTRESSLKWNKVQKIHGIRREPHIYANKSV